MAMTHIYVLLCAIRNLFLFFIGRCLFTKIQMHAKIGEFSGTLRPTKRPFTRRKKNNSSSKNDDRYLTISFSQWILQLWMQERERRERDRDSERERIKETPRRGGEGSACFPSPRLPPVLRHALVKINQTNAEEQTWTTSSWPCWEVQELENLVSFCVEKGFMYSIVTI